MADIVGTGGDGFDTFNASTAAALLVASFKVVKIAKHGNRSSSSQCGSADLLEQSGCALTPVDAEVASDILRDSDFCFLFAQNFHPAMKQLAAVRKQLGLATIFNYLGPLVNPCDRPPDFMVVGVNSPQLGPLFAECLLMMGVHRAWVVHGTEGLDEVSPEVDTLVWVVSAGESVKHTKISPLDFGIDPIKVSQVKGGDSKHNVKILENLMAARLPFDDPIRQFVAMNAAVLLVVIGHSETLKDGMEAAQKQIDSGAMLSTFQTFREKSNAAIK